MILYPAIDLLGGRVVRLRQGEYSAVTEYGDDPLFVAESFVEQGAGWVHVVDLDAARTGVAVNRPVIAGLARALAGRALIQTGGGVRSRADAAELAGAGVARVVMGSAAVADPGLVDAVADVVRVAVGLDHRAGTVATHGWTESSGMSVADALARFPAAEAFVVTDISRDGMLSGADLVGLAAAAAATKADVIASGGIGSLADLAALAGVPAIAGVIVGKALYESRFTVAEALGVLA